MTKEDIRQAANAYGYLRCGGSLTEKQRAYNGYIAGAESRQSEIDELLRIIEQLKKTDNLI